MEASRQWRLLVGVALSLACTEATTEEADVGASTDTDSTSGGDSAGPGGSDTNIADVSSEVSSLGDVPPPPPDVELDQDAEPLNPCVPNPCVNPGLACDGDTLRSWGPAECTFDIADATEAVCIYPTPETTDCAGAGLRCKEVSASCVQCLNDSDCGDLEECDLTLNVCTTGCVDDAYEDNDTQEQAKPIVSAGTVSPLTICASAPDWFSVTLDEPAALSVRLLSDVVGVAVDMALVTSDGEELVAVPEDGSPTVRSGLLAAGVHFLRISTAVAGVTVPYSLELELGAGPACIPNPCVAPATGGCEGNSVVSYATEGTCTDVGGAAQCSFEAEAPLDCGSAVCLAGSCSPHRLPQPGELVFSEVMLNPAPPLTPTAGQWIELMNVGADTVTTQTLTLWIGDESVVLDAQYIAPGDVAVIGRNQSSAVTGGVVVDLVAALPALATTGGTLRLRVDDVELDAVTIDASFPLRSGASVALRKEQFSSASNDDGAAWCTTRVPYGPGGKGSPGAVNGACEWTVTECRIQARRDSGSVQAIESSLLMQVGDQLELIGLVTIPGLTDLTTGFDALSPLVKVEAGLGLAATIDEDWSWEPASPDTLAADQASDRWVSPLATTPPGNWHVAYRVSGDAGETWRVCDADGGEYDGPVLLAAKANACGPGVCPIPLSTCAGPELRLYDDSSVGCSSKLGVAYCSFTPSAIVDCSSTGERCDPVSLTCVGCAGDEECSTPFEACVEEACVPQCADDDREDDDSADTPSAASPGDIDGVLCANDRDHLGYSLLSGQRLTLTVTPKLLGESFESMLLEVLTPDGSTALYAQLGGEPATYALDVAEGQDGLWVVRLAAAGTGEATYTVTAEVITNNCIAEPCTPTLRSCTDATTLSESYLTGCTPEAVGRTCEYGEPATYACAGYCVKGACQPSRPPEPGELVITEAHQDDLGWWVELVVNAPNISAQGLVLRKDGATFGTFNLPALSTGIRVVVAAAPGVPASIVVLVSNPGVLPESGTVELAYNDVVIDSATWAMGLAQTVGISTTLSDATSNDTAGDFCTQSSTYLPGAFGTPGAPNDACPLKGIWCRFQHPEAAEEEPGATLSAFVRLYIAGLSDLSVGVDPDSYDRLRVEAAYGPAANAPATWSSWTTALPAPNWNGSLAVPTPEPNNDEYVAALSLPSTPGSYRLAGRVSGDRGLTWTYCDLGNANQALDGSADGYSASTAATLVVAGACPAGSCTTPKPASCDGTDRVQEVPTGECALQSNVPVCTYSEVRNTCTFGCINAACVSPVAAGAGDVSLTELTVTSGAVVWVEVRNNTSAAIGLGGYLLGDVPLVGAVFVPADGRVVIGTAANDFPLGTVSVTGLTELALRTPDGVNTLSSLPLPDGDGHVMLSEEPPGSPYGTRHCGGTATPDQPNGLCPIAVGWCNLQYPLSLTATPGEMTTTYGRVYVADLTPGSTAVDAYPGLLAEVGYGPAGAAPDENWVWQTAAPNAGWNGQNALPFPAPNDDEYQATITWPTGSATLDFAYRFSGDSGATWLICDGANGSADGYSPATAGHVTLD